MNIKNLDLNLLLVFESLMIEKNVTRAAHRSGLSQPAMSNALGRLRRTFDDQLLIRTPNGMKPTPLAQSLIEPVRTALDNLRAVIDEKTSFDETSSHRIFHIMANDYVDIMLISDLIQDIHAKASGVSLKIERSQSQFQAPPPALLTDSFDLALGFFTDAPSLDPNLQSELLWEEQNICIARKGHPSIQNKLSLKQFVAAHHAAIFYDSERVGLIDRLLLQKGYERKTAVYAPHYLSVLYMVAASDLIATVPKRLALKLFKELKLQIFPVPFAFPPFYFRMLWHKRNHNDPAHRWLRSRISETAKS